MDVLKNLMKMRDLCSSINKQHSSSTGRNQFMVLRGQLMGRDNRGTLNPVDSAGQPLTLFETAFTTLSNQERLDLMALFLLRL